MTEPSAAPHTHLARGQSPAATILQTINTLLGEAAEDSTITSAKFVPNANITGAASPASRTLNVINRGQDGSGAVVMASLAFLAGINGVSGDEIAFTLSGTAANLLAVKGDVIEVQTIPVGGTGLVDPGGLVEITLARR